MNDKQNNSTNINEFLDMLAKKRAAERQNEDDKEGPMVEPIICNGIADIIVKDEEKEM